MIIMCFVKLALVVRQLRIAAIRERSGRGELPIHKLLSIPVMVASG